MSESESLPLRPQSSTLLCDVGGAYENQHEIATKFWSRSLRKSEKYDKELVDTWKGDAEGILIFTGLFSSTLQDASTDSGDTTVQILSQISGQLVAISSGTVLSTPPLSSQFRPSSGSIRVNVLWFLSLCLSLTCALVATMMQQWSRNFLRMAQEHRSDPAARVRLRAFAFDGVSKFHMSHALGLVPLLLHISVFLFFLGMVDFLFPINDAVAFVVVGFIISMTCIYLLLTIFPLSCLDFPYSTPLSPIVWRLADFPARVLSSLHWLALTIFRLWTTYKWDMKRWHDARDDTLFNVPSVYHQFRISLRKRYAAQAVHADASVLGKQLIRELDTTEDVDEIEAFFEGMHAALAIDTAFRPVIKYLVEHQMLLSFRFQCLFDSCDNSLPEPTRHRRTLVGVRAVWHVFSLKPEDYPFRLLIGAPFEGASAASWFLAMAPLLCHEERTIAVAARCIQAIVASNAVTKVLPEEMADLDTLTSLVNSPPNLQHAVRDTDGLRANGGLLILINLLADLAEPLSAGGALSVQIARIVCEVVPWLFPPWELRECVVPAVRDALADACSFVLSLAEVRAQVVGRPPSVRPRTHSSTRTVAAGQYHASCERPDAFTKLVEELRALVTFLGSP
ncbi:hypothetical protein BJV74DRAFT_873828 [Russula compacta]|nr:hypothetical protein BJV74DRAFT_873828 [Russula compacta]